MHPSQAVREKQAGIGEQFERAQARGQVNGQARVQANGQARGQVRPQRSQSETYPQIANRITNVGIAFFVAASKFCNPTYDFNDCVGIVAFGSCGLLSTQDPAYRSRLNHSSYIFLNTVLLSSNCYSLVTGKSSYREILSTAQCIANIVNETYILSKIDR